ncbi:unnamed protein product [Paramecium octaurelia]|uniref:Transmembrane protein n=1 Tax=Paramecium octaurelia TaxID=43137 RepID=A0A8S1TY05_PAROT|nr:unnamed protein product [Paramecium octaurelia]
MYSVNQQLIIESRKPNNQLRWLLDMEACLSQFKEIRKNYICSLYNIIPIFHIVCKNIFMIRYWSFLQVAQNNGVFIINMISQIYLIYSSNNYIFSLFREFKLFLAHINVLQIFHDIYNACISFDKILYLFTFYNYKFEVKISTIEQKKYYSEKELRISFVIFTNSQLDRQNFNLLNYSQIAVFERKKRMILAFHQR